MFAINLIKKNIKKSGDANFLLSKFINTRKKAENFK